MIRARTTMVATGGQGPIASDWQPISVRGQYGAFGADDTPASAYDWPFLLKVAIITGFAEAVAAYFLHRYLDRRSRGRA